MGWAIGYARQAKSDFMVRDCLLSVSPPLPRCHELHYLQMAMEKLCKAHLLETKGATSDDVKKSHAHIASPLRVIVRQMLARSKGGGNSHWVIDAVGPLATKIERLSPAVGGDSYPSNCEYPWCLPNGSVIAPVDYDFDLVLLPEKTVERILRLALARLAEILEEGQVE